MEWNLYPDYASTSEPAPPPDASWVSMEAIRPTSLIAILKTKRRVSSKKATKVKAKYLATGRLPLGWHVEDVVR